MARGTAHPVLRFIRRIAAPRTVESPDARLLDDFVARGDAAAFAELVRRHGPTVFGACARVLGDGPDAEDAFQATFLVLVRRAASVGNPASLGPWLYGVAYRTALKARSDVARRRRHEARAGRGPARESDDADRCDVWPVLDEELNRLPAKYRVPLVLCYLEGRTHEEAARQLGCPRETVTTRLVRGRARLRDRMARRGVLLSAGALAVSVPEVLAEATVDAATRFAAGQTAARAAALAEGVIRAMLLNRLKVSAAVLLGLGAAAWGATVLARHELAAGPEPRQVAPPAPGRAAPPADGPAVSVKSLPPVVVKTVPQSGDTQVDAKAVTEIRATFSKDMTDQSWSWAQTSEETFPKTAGKISYDKDKRTCVLPVKLEPGKTYVIWLNSEKFRNFKDADGHSAVPYLLVFETKK